MDCNTSLELRKFISMTQVEKLSTDLGRLQIKPVPMSLGETLNMNKILSI